MTFEGIGRDGNYLSCFPAEDHFDWSKNHKPPIDNIQFGMYDGEPLYTYTRAEFRDGKYWWTRVNTDGLLDRVKAWLATNVTEPQVGDAMAIFLTAHSNKDNEVRIGTNWFGLTEFYSLISGFNTGVTVDLRFAFSHFSHFVDITGDGLKRTHFRKSGYESKDRVFGLARSRSGRIRNTVSLNQAIKELSQKQPPWVSSNSDAPCLGLDLASAFSTKCTQLRQTGQASSATYTGGRPAKQKDLGKVGLSKEAVPPFLACISSPHKGLIHLVS
jgi:hypothetical protein